MKVAEFVSWLHNWQELAGAVIGAALGAVMGTVGALIVSRNDKRREERKEERTAARLLMLELVTFESAHRELGRARAEQKINDRDFPSWLSEMLLRSHYKISPLFDAQLKAVAHLEGSLVADLKAFAELCSQMEEDLAVIGAARIGNVMTAGLSPDQRRALLPEKLEKAHKAAASALETLDRYV